jgi:hypothetical protein
VQGAGRRTRLPQPSRWRSGEADGDRLGDQGHAIECLDGEGGLAPLAGQVARPQLGADQVFVPADGGLAERAAPVSRARCHAILPRSAMSPMWRSRGLCLVGSSELGTAVRRQRGWPVALPRLDCSRMVSCCFT